MNPKKRFSPEVELEIVNKYLSGVKSSELVREYEFDRRSINLLLKRHGLAYITNTRKGGRPKMDTSIVDKEIVRLHSEGLSQTQIGKSVGLSQCVISRVIRNNGLTANTPVRKRGIDSQGWKGGIIKQEDGYILTHYDVHGGPKEMYNKAGYVHEHRITMAKYLGRPLLRSETIHHIDGIRDNNNIDNLQLRIGQHGKGQVYCCCECGSKKLTPIKI